ncbi:hypothetical protein CEXT_684161 [Caerostris extrusa]|uniref:Uncharacterized protein n=1 Tax=Caerostris extrusa TaxID=172846 RepID=A0AAV4T553_CAEEX|nr:hypothetical protein CEXT_684161 [Caerostris extrusa]
MERHKKKKYQILINTKEVVTSIDRLKSAFLWTQDGYSMALCCSKGCLFSDDTATTTADLGSTDAPEETSSTSTAMFPQLVLKQLV